MAESFHVMGPTTVQIKPTYSDGSWTNFGKTDNDDLVSFEIEDLYRDATRNDLGDMLAESIVLGTRVFVGMVLNYWDEALYQQMIARVRLDDVATYSADEGKHGSVGKLIVSDGMMFGIKILTSRSGERSYTIPRCRLASPARKENMGNAFTSLRLLVEGIPDGAGVIYTAANNP